MSDPYEYYAVGAPRPRRRPVLSVVSSGVVVNGFAVICVASALVLASMIHASFLLVGALVTMMILAAGAWLREGLEAENVSKRKALVDAGYLVTQEVAQCDKKDRNFVEKARAAVSVITSSKAAADGWLGDVDFTPDLFWIASSAVGASVMEELINILKPSRRPSDKHAVADGKSGSTPGARSWINE